jgi:hypothetical protein
MDFEERDDEEEGLPKWPFLASALFILSGALGFAYYHYHFSGQLEVWQLLVCILASGTASLLIFMPFLLERSLQLCLQTANRKDDELFRKVYFDLKEVGNELETLAVKVDKVPTLVDKIVSDSTKDLTQLTELSEALTETKEELALKLSNLEELATQEPPSPEPDPGIAMANQSISELGKSITNLSAQLAEISAQIAKLPTEFPAPIIQSVQETFVKAEQDQPSKKVETQDTIEEKESTEPSLEEILTEDAFSPDLPENETPDDPVEDLPETPSLEAEPSFEEPEDPIEVENPEDGSLNDQLEEEQEPPFEPTDDVSPEKVEDEDSESTEPKLEEETFDDLELEEPSLEVSENDEGGDEPAEEVPVDKESPPLDEPAELDLGLPAPEETLRKVDALLAGESTAPPPVKEEETPTKKAPGGMTTVIAKVMIGIGNKPYVRGEGPGLSWQEGVPMNFLEIGKWAWSPSRKNALVTIQIYRNDEDPDNTGKHEIKPGEKFELTPDFG